MKFLFITQSFPPEVGASRLRLAATIRELRKHNHHVEVITVLPSHPYGRIFPDYRGRFYLREEWEGIPVHRVWIYASTGAGMKRILNYFSFVFTSLVGVLRAKRPDYIFAESPPLLTSIPAYLAAKRWKVPFIFNMADLWPDTAREYGALKEGFLLRLAERLERWTYRKAAYLNVTAEGARTRLIEQKGVGPDKVLLLPNGVDTQLFRPLPYDESLVQEFGLQGKRVILYAGNHGYAHGLDVVLEAARLLENEEVCILLVGGGSEKLKLVDQARQFKLKNVMFLDPVSPEKVARLHAIADAGLATLRKLPLFEFVRSAKIWPIMACGKPVICSGGGETARLVEQANAGITVEPEHPEALAEAIRTVIHDPGLAHTLGQNGRAYVEEYLTWSELVQVWLKQLERNERGEA